LFRSAVGFGFRVLMPEQYKQRHELSFWRQRYKAEGCTLANDHYEKYYTRFFGIDRDSYRGKRLIDIGCGPRGSLEWADMAGECVGLDPLANAYLKLGADRHRMRYVNAPSESIPFPAGYFDAAFAFNSLDHVRDPARSVAEIKRIVRPGGVILLITEINHEPTPTEPQSLSWDVLDLFAPEFERVWSKAFEIEHALVYQAIDRGREYDMSDPTRRSALLCARFERRHIPNS
ncbi:MAG TPA: class I SAM-dependent methyltransferase, partial [Stellaceae bacterium]|nr:class I SAM-dependent methyltransferase [Stellaceae bacterium]